MINNSLNNIKFCELSKAATFVHNYSVDVDIDMLIGKNLSRLRKYKGLSQEKLAEMINTPATRLSAYETGREGMGKDIMSRICKALDVQPYEFYITETTPLPATDLERKAMYMAREAGKAKLEYVAEEVVAYGSDRIQKLKKQKKETGAHPGRAARLKAG